MLNSEIAGIALGAVATGVVELLKAYGLPIRYARWANVAVSAVLWGLATAFESYEDSRIPVIMIINFLTVILSSAGFYSTVTKPLKERHQ